jgi:hypothetical protein
MLQQYGMTIHYHELCATAQVAMNKEIFTWALDRCKFNELTVQEKIHIAKKAAQNKMFGLESLAMLKAKGVLFTDVDITKHAIETDNVEAYAFLVENDCPLPRNAFESALRQGSIHILRYMHHKQPEIFAYESALEFVRHENPGSEAYKFHLELLVTRRHE